MSQLADFPLAPLTNDADTQVPIEDYLQITNLINDTLSQVKGKSVDNPTGYPNYYDDLLNELIDAVPLE